MQGALTAVLGEDIGADEARVLRVARLLPGLSDRGAGWDHTVLGLLRAHARATLKAAAASHPGQARVAPERFVCPRDALITSSACQREHLPRAFAIFDSFERTTEVSGLFSSPLEFFSLSCCSAAATCSLPRFRRRLFSCAEGREAAPVRGGYISRLEVDRYRFEIVS